MGVPGEQPQDHHAAQLLRQTADCLFQRQMLIGIRPGGVRQSVHAAGMKPPPAAQFVLTGVDQDPGDPGLEKRRRLQLFQFPQRPVHRLVHRLKGVGLAAQIQIRRAVQPGLDGFRPVGKLLLIHRDRLLSALFCLLDGDVPRFVFTKENFFKKTGGASALPVVTLLGAPSGRRP